MNVLSQLAACAALLLLPLAAPAQQLFTKPAASDLPMGGHNITNAGTVSAASFNGSLPWSDLSGVPTTLAAYGITDPLLLASGSYNNPAWLASLSPAKLTGGAGASYLFVGDSITYGQYLSSPTTQCFQAVFATLPFCDGALTRNVGVPGWTIANIAGDYAAHVQPHRPTANGGDGGAQAYLVLMIGINDAFTGRTGAQMISDATAYITQAQADGFTIVLATILPSSNAPTTYTAQKTYNEAIRAGLIPYNLLWDANSVLTDPTNPAIFSDGIHPTAAAHARLAHSLQSALMAQGGSVGAPALYTSDVVSVGGLNIGGNGTFGGSVTSPGGYFTSSESGIWVGTNNSLVSGHSNVIDDGSGNLYLEAVAPANDVYIAHNIASSVNIGAGGGNVFLGAAGSGTYVEGNFGVAGSQISMVNTLNTYAILTLGSTGSGGAAIDYEYGNTVAWVTQAETGTFEIVDVANSSNQALQVTSGNPGTVKLNYPLLIKSGTNALAGTVTLSSGTATITSSAIDANTVIALSLKTSGGTPGASMPRTNVGSGSATVAGLSTDNSTYNWIGLKVN